MRKQKFVKKISICKPCAWSRGLRDPSQSRHLFFAIFHRMWKKSPKVENVPSIAIENVVLSPSVRFIRWKVHDDWVNEVTYRLYPKELNSVLLCLARFSSLISILLASLGGSVPAYSFLAGYDVLMGEIVM